MGHQHGKELQRGENPLDIRRVLHHPCSASFLICYLTTLMSAAVTQQSSTTEHLCIFGASLLALPFQIQLARQLLKPFRIQ